jgi:hypothetical protein
VLPLPCIFQVTESKFTFKAQDYELEFDFFGSIDSALILQSLLYGALHGKYTSELTFQNLYQEKASWKVGARDVAFVLPRKESGEYWDKLAKGCVRVRAHAQRVFGVRLRAFGAISRIKTSPVGSDADA